MSDEREQLRPEFDECLKREGIITVGLMRETAFTIWLAGRLSGMEQAAQIADKFCGEGNNPGAAIREKIAQEKPTS